MTKLSSACLQQSNDIMHRGVSSLRRVLAVRRLFGTLLASSPPIVTSDTGKTADSVQAEQRPWADLVPETRGLRPTLSLHEVHASYGKKEVLRGLNLQVAAGEIVALLGGNGAGKSTTLKVIAGLLRPSAGDVSLSGENVSGLLPHEIQRRGVGVVLQGGRVFPNLTVAENLDVSIQACSRSKSKGTPKNELFFPRLGDLWTRRAGLLSGGERQMLGIELILQQCPNVLLLDEPSAGLAPVLVRETFQRIATFAKETGCAILLIEQNTEEARRIATSELILVDGRISAEANASTR